MFSWNLTVTHGRYIAPLRHIILTLNQLVFLPLSLCYMLSGEEANEPLQIVGLIQLEIEPKIYRTGGEHANHYHRCSSKLWNVPSTRNKCLTTLFPQFQIQEIFNLICFLSMLNILWCFNDNSTKWHGEREIINDREMAI